MDQETTTAPVTERTAAAAGTDAAAANEDDYENSRGRGNTSSNAAESAVRHEAGDGVGFGDASDTYWFYIDYGGNPAYENGWASSFSDTPLNALRAALDVAGIKYDITSSGMILGIGGSKSISSGIDAESFFLTGWGWHLWSWSAAAGSSGRWAESDDYLERASGKYFYIAFSYWEWDMVRPKPTVRTDPNRENVWKDGGPPAPPTIVGIPSKRSRTF